MNKGPLAECRRRWEAFWYAASYASLTLALLRIAFCTILLAHAAGAPDLASFAHGPESDYFANGFYSPYAEWLRPPSYPVFVWLGRALVVCAVMALVGAWTRVSLFLAAGLFFYQFFLNRFWYANNFYLLGLGTLLCGFIPCGERLSVDAWIARRRGRRPPLVVTSWAARLLQVLVSLVYLGSATSKLTPAWLSGDLTGAFYTVGKMSAPGWMAFIERVPAVWQAWAALGTEYFLAFGLWSRRWKYLALGVGVGFHAFMDVTMPISSFSWQMVTFYLLFLNPRRCSSWNRLGRGRRYHEERLRGEAS